MTTLDNNIYKALGMIAPDCVALLMKTEPDVDKVLAVLPEIDQKVAAGLKDCDQFEPALVYAIKAIVDKQKETRTFCAGWSAAQERAKAAKEIVDNYNFAQTVASTASTVDTHGVRIDGLDEQFVAQNKINEGVQQDLSFNAGEHIALKGRVNDQRRAMDKVKHFVEGAIVEQSRMAETLDNKFMTEERERKELREERQELHCLTVKKAEAAAEAQTEARIKDQMYEDKCGELAASDEANRVLTAQNADLKAQLALAKNSGEQAASFAKKEIVSERKHQERVKNLLTQTRRESHDRHKKETEQIVSQLADTRARTKALEGELDAARREAAAVEAERDMLMIKVRALEDQAPGVKELEARLLVADERAATLNAKTEELAAKLKDALAADAQKFTELEKAKIALRQAHDQQSKVSGAADELRGRCVKLEADLVAARAEVKALAEKLTRRCRRSPALSTRAPRSTPTCRTATRSSRYSCSRRSPVAARRP